MKSILVASFLLVFGYTVAQQQSKISGIIVDSADKALQYATIGIFVKKEGKADVVAYSDSNGLFAIKHSLTGDYWLFISHNGYEDYWKKITIVTKDYNAGKIRLINSVKQLQGVTVKSSKRLVTMRDDGVSYNAENDPMANSDKAIDLLRKTPMVGVDGEGKITVNGETSFRVLVNGRETAQFARNANEALKNYPGSIIKRIDVITNPSAKYDAEGVGGIINIITKKNVVGYNASVNLWNNFFNPFDWSSNVARGGNVTFNMKKGKIGLVAGLLYDGNQNFLNRMEESIQSFGSVAFSKRVGAGTISNSTYSPEGNLELTYEADSLNTISVYGTFDKARNYNNKDKQFTLNGSTVGNVILSEFSDNSNRKSIDWSMGVDYIKKFKTNPAKEFSLKFFGVFGEANLDNTSDQLNNVGSNRFVLNDNFSNDKQYTMQADYLLPDKNKGVLEIGSKMILRRAISDYQSYFKNIANDAYKTNLTNSDNFRYMQDVYSLYTSKNFSIGKFNFRTGLRMEHTVIDGRFISSNTQVNQSYTRWLPNLLISTRMKNRQNMSFSYSQRLNRPYVNSLNPFVNNIDSLNVNTGNPDLGPQLSHVTNLQYKINGKKLFATFSVGYSFSNSYIIFGYFFNNLTGVTTAQPQNGGRSKRAFLNISLNANPIQSLRINFNGDVSHLIISSPSLGGQSNSGFSGSMNMNGSYTAGNKLALTYFINHYFPVLLLQGTVNAYSSYGFGGRYIIVKDKLFANISLNNLFNKNGEMLRINRFADQNFSSETRTFSRFRGVTLSLTWNFGKLSEEVSKKKGVNNTDLL